MKVPARLASHALARSTWIEVDRNALQTNIQQMRKRLATECLLMAVVKANAYGHEALPVAQTFAEAGADRLAVATLSEAVALRQGGIHTPIQVLGHTPEWQVAEALRHEIILTLFDPDSAEALAAAAAQQGTRATVHVKINTGMNRLGLSPGEGVAFLARLARYDALDVEGIFTHFSTADTDRDFSRAQFREFTAFLADLTQQGLRPRLAHAANSAATLTMPETHLDMVRCGIALYGLDPDVEGTPLPAAFQPALAWKAQVSQVRRLQPGDAVSYGCQFVADRPLVTATIPVGYADGFPRQPRNWGEVLVGGEPAPILGRVCMDQCVVDVSAAAARGDVRPGDEVVLIGRQGSHALSVNDVADRLGTINYDVVSRILPRVPRILVDPDTADGAPELLHRENAGQAARDNSS